MLLIMNLGVLMVLRWQRLHRPPKNCKLLYFWTFVYLLLLNEYVFLVESCLISLLVDLLCYTLQYWMSNGHECPLDKIEWDWKGLALCIQGKTYHIFMLLLKIWSIRRNPLFLMLAYSTYYFSMLHCLKVLLC